MNPPVLAANSRFGFGTRYQVLEGKALWMEWKPPHLKLTNEKMVVVSDAEVGRMDLIAWEAYQNVDLWWLICWWNNIRDPFKIKTGDRLRIPYFDQTTSLPVLEIENDGEDLVPITNQAKYYPPPYVRQQITVNVLTLPFLFNFSFPVPEIEGLLHFQLQVSEDADFTNILISRFTAVNQDRWSYFNPAANGGVGAHVAFPATGVEGSSMANVPVYLQFRSDDPVVKGQEYYVRWRHFHNEQESAWNSSAPMILWAER